MVYAVMLPPVSVPKTITHVISCSFRLGEVYCSYFSIAAAPVSPSENDQVDEFRMSG